ncbi:MAG TPA: hypothetical protein VF815_40170 [Myxococcaceae bacterium]
MKLRVFWLGAMLLALGVTAGACDCGGTEDPDPDPTTDGGNNGGGNDGGNTGGNDGGNTGGNDGGTTGGNDGGSTGGNDGGTGGGGGSDGGSGVCVPAMCGGKTYLCGDCLDNDNDGKKDSQDPDCLGPCHNTENSFDLGIPGGGHGNCGSIECYYDSDTGGGNDNCVYDLRCDPKEPDPTCRYPPPGNVTCTGTQSNTCTSVCGPLTPNGCDCFGCCTVTLPTGGTRDIFLGSEAANKAAGINAPPCTLANAGNTTACRACTPNPSCYKGCGTCQLCLGKTELPPECTPSAPTDGGTPPKLPDGGTIVRCPGGEQACGLPTDPACPANAYCITGCCIVIQ